MEGKVVIMSVVLVSFLVVLGQIQVEAQPRRACCPSTSARNKFDRCRATLERCVSLAGCVIVTGRLMCPPGYPFNMPENTVNEYCKLGCVSSVCGAITTLQNSGEVVNGAVEKCTNACFDYCTKGSVITAVDSTA